MWAAASTVPLTNSIHELDLEARWGLLSTCSVQLHRPRSGQFLSLLTSDPVMMGMGCHPYGYLETEEAESYLWVYRPHVFSWPLLLSRWVSLQEQCPWSKCLLIYPCQHCCSVLALTCWNMWLGHGSYQVPLTSAFCGNLGFLTLCEYIFFFYSKQKQFLAHWKKKTKHIVPL